MKRIHYVVGKRILAGILSIVLVSSNLTGFSMTSLAAGVSKDENLPNAVEGSEETPEDSELTAKTEERTEETEPEEPEEVEEVKEPEASDDGEEAEAPKADEEAETPEDAEEADAEEVQEDPDFELTIEQQEKTATEPEAAAASDQTLPSGEEVTGTVLFMEGDNIYAFTPTSSGEFVSSEDQIYYYDEETGDWQPWEKDVSDVYCMTLTAGTTYLLKKSGTDSLVLGIPHTTLEVGKTRVLPGKNSGDYYFDFTVSQAGGYYLTDADGECITRGCEEITQIEIKRGSHVIEKQLVPLNGESAYLWELQPKVTYRLNVTAFAGTSIQLNQAKSVPTAVTLEPDGEAASVSQGDAGYFCIDMTDQTSGTYYIGIDSGQDYLDLVDEDAELYEQNGWYWLSVYEYEDENDYFLIPNASQDVQVRLVSYAVFAEALAEWSGNKTLDSKKTITWEYQTSQIGDYYLEVPGSDVSIKSMAGSLSQKEELDNGNVRWHYTNNRPEGDTFCFSLSNTGDEAVTVTFYTHDSLQPTSMLENESYGSASGSVSVSYYIFTAPYTGYYKVEGSCNWIYWNSNHKWLDTKMYSYIPLAHGDMITLASQSQVKIVGSTNDFSRTEGSEITMKPSSHYVFVPEESGRYEITPSSEDNKPDYMNIYWFDRSDYEWKVTTWKYDDRSYYMNLEADQTYFMYMESGESNKESGCLIQKTDDTVVVGSFSGSTLKMTSDGIYYFTPTVTGTFVSADETIQYYDDKEDEWKYWTKKGTTYQKQLVKKTTYKLRKSCGLDLMIGIRTNTISANKTYTLLGLQYEDTVYEFTPTKTAFYYQSLDGKQTEDDYLWATLSAVYEKSTNKFVEGQYIPLGSEFKNVWKLEKGKTYLLSIGGILGAPFMIKEATSSLTKTTTLKANGAVQTIKKNATGRVKLVLDKPSNNYTIYYIGMSSKQKCISSNLMTEIAPTEAFYKDGYYWFTATNEAYKLFDDNDAYLLFPKVTKDTKIKMVTSASFTETLKIWTQEITLQPGAEKYYSYQTDVIGDYCIEWNDNNVNVETLGNLLGIPETLENGNKRASFTNAYNEKMTCAFRLTNPTDEVQTVKLYKEDTVGIVPLETGPHKTDGLDYKRSVYSFTAPETGIYMIDSRNIYMAYRQSDGRKCLDYDGGTIPMFAGETIIFATFINYSVNIVEDCSLPIHEGTSLNMNRRQYYAFQPDESGVYGLYEQDANYLDAYRYDREKDSWEKFQWDATKKAYCMDLEAGETYFLRFESNSTSAILTKEQQATVIDYDYYQAFTASGGSVTVDGSQVSIAKGKSGWKQLLQKAVYSIIGSLTGKSREDRYTQSNKYWKTKEGPYIAAEFYKLEDGTNSEPTPIDEDEIKADDVVLIKYEPEIVWVQSLKVTAAQNNTTLQTGETVKLNANPSKGQSKYDYRETPVITWTSSNPEIVKVEGEGEEATITAVGSGVATITATADEALRASEGLKPIAVSSLKFTVYEKPTLQALKVVPARTDIELAYNKSTGTYQPVTTYATVQVDPSNFMLDNSNLTWSWVNNETDKEISTSAAVTFTEAGEYTVTATYKKGAEDEKSASETVKVTEALKTIPLATNVEINRISNLESGLKLSDVSSKIEEKLLESAKEQGIITADENGKYGTFEYKNGTKKWTASTAFPKNKSTKLTVTFTPKKVADGYASTSVTATVTINYAALSIKSAASSEGNTLVYVPKGETNSTNYPTQTEIIPTFSYNGKSWSLEALEQLLNDGASEGSKYVLTNAVNVTKNGQCVGFFFNTVSAKAAGTVTLNSAVTVRKETTISESETACTTETFKSKSLSITVKSMSPVVETITVSQKDRIALKDNASLYYEKKSDEQQIVLNVSAQDFADESFETLYATKGESAKLQWSTSNKKVAYVSATESSTKLIIPKNASGVAKITVKSGTNASAQMTFNVVVYDTDVRLDTTKVALNSYSDTSGTIYLYPNIILADQAQTAESQSSDENDENGETEAQPDYKIDIQPVKQTIVNKKVVGYEADTRFEVSDYDLSSGTVQIRFADSAVNTKKGSYTVYLKITQTVKGSELDPVYKKITVTNTPSVPKATVKVLKTYNQFLGQNAVLQVTTSAELKKAVNLTDVIKLNADGGKYEIANITKTAANQYQVELQATSAVASLKVGKTSKSNVSVTVGYANYRKASQSASVNVTVENKAPTLSLSAYQPKNATIYSKLDNTIQVLLTLPTEVKAADVYQEYQSNAGILQLTSAVQKEKKFKISQVALAEDSNALIVTLTSLSGKSGSVQFTLGKVAPLTGSVTSGKLTINVKNVNTMKLSMQDTTTGKSATTYTLRQMSAGKEVLNLKAILSDSSIDYSTSVYAADTFTDNALKSKALVLVKSDDGKSFQVKATAALFKLITKKNNSCKLKFTAYSGNVALNSATVTLKLDTTAEKKVAIKVSLKASGTLNVVDPASTVTITPTFTNVPLGATIKEVSFTDTADVNRYDKKVNEQTGKLTLSLHRNEDGSYASIPTGKDSIGLKYKILQVDGTYRELTASTTITVAQTATVKANQTSLTLYNVATGISYGKTVTLNVTKAGNASVKSISISGLSGSGISWKQDTDTPNRITFYVDPVQNRGIDGKTYTANLTVTLNGAGTKSGKIITYNVPVKINLAK